MPRSKPDELAGLDDVATAMILEQDLTQPGWQRRAVGVDRPAALAQIPEDDALAVVQAQMAVAAYRVLQRHILNHGVNQAEWFRDAIIDRYLAEGGDPDVAARMQLMRKPQRRHHVPRDAYGQDRSRQGRKGSKGSTSTW